MLSAQSRKENVPPSRRVNHKQPARQQGGSFFVGKSTSASHHSFQTSTLGVDDASVSWGDLIETYPWGVFLAEGGFKKVFKVYNRPDEDYEAVSVMDLQWLKDPQKTRERMAGAELAVAMKLSDLVRDAICPNFVVIRGSFSCTYEAPARLWGSESNPRPRGKVYQPTNRTTSVNEPTTNTGRYQYIRMEFCDGGDVRNYMNKLRGGRFSFEQGQQVLLQMAAGLQIAKEQVGLKHYDIKAENWLIQSIPSKTGGDIVLRYDLGDRVFALRSPPGTAFMVKLADFGFSNIDPATNGQPVTRDQFTTCSITPADFMILGDKATQGHGHDNFGLGLTMLHFYAGQVHFEIMENVKCPANLKTRLQNIWEDEDEEFSVIRSMILSGVVMDEKGNILKGKPKVKLYHTFYWYLVLFGLPDDLPTALCNSKVWLAVKECLEGSKDGSGRVIKTKPNDVVCYTRHCKEYSLKAGNNEHIKRARKALESLDGGMELLLSLVSFDPDNRSTPLDVMNSKFMKPLREGPDGMAQYRDDEDIHTYSALSSPQPNTASPLGASSPQPNTASPLGALAPAGISVPKHSVVQTPSGRVTRSMSRRGR